MGEVREWGSGGGEGVVEVREWGSEACAHYYAIKVEILC